MGETVKRIFYETDLKAYNSFLENEWTTKIMEDLESHKVLQELIIDLIINWRGASYTTYLPLQTIDHVQSFYEGYQKSDRPNYNLVRLTEIIIQRFNNKIPEFKVDPTLARKMKTEIIKIGSDVNEAFDKVERIFPLEETWNEYLKTPSHQITLWSTQRICYVALFSAFENFIIQSLKIGLSVSSYQINRDTNKDIKTVFGDQILSKCWANDKIDLIRQTRHCLVHGAGKISAKLKQRKHNFEIIDDEIQITPTDTKNSYNTLKEAVTIFTKNAKKHPNFNLVGT